MKTLTLFSAYEKAKELVGELTDSIWLDPELTRDKYKKESNRWGRANRQARKFKEVLTKRLQEQEEELEWRRGVIKRVTELRSDLTKTEEKVAKLDKLIHEEETDPKLPLDKHAEKE